MTSCQGADTGWHARRQDRQYWPQSHTSTFFNSQYYVPWLWPLWCRRRVCTSILPRSSHVLTKDADSPDSTRPLHYSKSDCRVSRSPVLSPWSSLTHAHRSIGYRNRNPQLLSESVTRLMFLRVYDNRDNSRQPAPSPSLWYSLTHAQKSIGYHNHNPQLLTESTTRLMYLRVYGNRDRSRQSGTLVS